MPIPRDSKADRIVKWVASCFIAAGLVFFMVSTVIYWIDPESPLFGPPPHHYEGVVVGEEHEPPGGMYPYFRVEKWRVKVRALSDPGIEEVIQVSREVHDECITGSLVLFSSTGPNWPRLLGPCRKPDK
jgi:hypothetical protein